MSLSDLKRDQLPLPLQRIPSPSPIPGISPTMIIRPSSRSGAPSTIVSISPTMIERPPSRLGSPSPSPIPIPRISPTMIERPPSRSGAPSQWLSELASFRRQFLEEQTPPTALTRSGSILDFMDQSGKFGRKIDEDGREVETILERTKEKLDDRLVKGYENPLPINLSAKTITDNPSSQ